jgi:hypothetical protein
VKNSNITWLAGPQFVPYFRRWFEYQEFEDLQLDFVRKVVVVLCA